MGILDAPGVSKRFVEQIGSIIADIDLSSTLPAGATFTRSGSAYALVDGTYSALGTNVPRFESYGGVLQGVLVEGGETQFITNPRTFTGLSSIGLSMTQNQTDRYGTNIAALVTGDGAGGSQFVAFTGGVASASLNYVISAEVKPNGNLTRIQLNAGSGAFGSGKYANFNLVGRGAVTASAGVGSAGIEPLSDGWYRIWITVAPIASASVSMSLAFISSATAGQIVSGGQSNSFFVSFVQIEFASAANPLQAPTSFMPTSGVRTAESLILNLSAYSIGNDTYIVRYYFNDDTYQDVQTNITSQSLTVPTTLNRRHIKRIIFYSVGPMRTVAVQDTQLGTQTVSGVVTDTTTTPHWRGRVAQTRFGSLTTSLATHTGKLVGLMYIGQSNSVSSGTGNASVFTTARFPYHAFKFSAGRNQNGDPSQSGALVSSIVLNSIEPTNDDNTFAGFPMTIQAFLAQYWSRYHGVEESPFLTRSDALGGASVASLRSGAESDGSPKYFYLNSRETQKGMAAIAALYGLDLDLRKVFIQGEDPSVATDLYQTYLSNNIIDPHFADAMTDTGKRPSSFVIMQTNGLADGSNDQRPGPLAHIAETRRRRGTAVALAGPMYSFPLSGDTIHLSNVGRLMMGDLINYVQREVARNGSFTPLDIARTSTPALAANQGLRAPGLSAGTIISGLGTGTGGTGTYTVNNSQTVASRKFVAFGAIFVGSISGTTLTVTSIIEGKLDVTLSSATVTVKMNRSIKIDQDWVPTVGSAYGFEWTDAGSSRTISSVAVSGDTVTITLSGAPSGAMTLGYAVSNCDPSYYQTGGSSESNWTATRGQIYSDSNVEATAYVVGSYGTQTIRLYLPRILETF